MNNHHPMKEEPNAYHQQNEQANCGLAIRWSKENKQSTVTCKSTDELHKPNKH